MSKVSIFKFNINDFSKIELVRNIVNQYLTQNGFNYDNENKCYITKVTDRTLVPNVPGFVRYTGTWGFNFDILNNELIIKAFVVNPMLKTTDYIHSKFNNSPAGTDYYKNIKNNLFQTLSANGILMSSKEVEKIKDKSGSKTFVFILGIFIIYALLMLLVFILLFK